MQVPPILVGSIIQKLNSIIDEASKLQASDIHFEPFKEFLQIRFRIDGVLKIIYSLPKVQQNEYVARIKILSDLDISERRRPQDSKFEHNGSLDNLEIRVSILPTQYGEKVVLRLLNTKNQNLDIRKLGYYEQDLNNILPIIESPNGLILVTGPTGSGKSTTLYSFLNFKNTPEVNITTIEDPVEISLQGVNQTKVRPDLNFNFSHALRSILRQDPDIIMLGEIRDSETASIAMRASLTGHLVFSTLHTNDALATIYRLIDMGIEPFLIATSLKLILAQRLIRKLCQYCIGKGCENCNSIGYKGRTVIYEYIIIDDEVAHMINSKVPTRELHLYLLKKGFITMKDFGATLLNKSITSQTELNRVLAS